jgi:hypothetical protein
MLTQRKTNQEHCSRREKNRQNKRLGNRQKHHAVVKSAPFLHKETVTLTSVEVLSGGTNGGTFFALTNGNGLTVQGTTTPEVP